MNPMPKLPLALLTLAMMTGIASAQQRILRRERQGRRPFGERVHDRQHDDDL